MELFFQDRQLLNDGGTVTPEHNGESAPVTRGALDGCESFLRAALGVEIFAERSLLEREERAGRLRLRPLPGQRAELEQSAYICRLRQILDTDERGGC